MPYLPLLLQVGYLECDSMPGLGPTLNEEEWPNRRERYGK